MMVKSYGLGSIQQLRPYGDPRAPRVRSAKTISQTGHYVEVPRWVEYVGDQATPTALSEIFDPKVVATGVAFADQLQAFKRQHDLAPISRELKALNLTNLEIHFAVFGIVQKCGTRGALQRIWNLVSLDQRNSLQVENDRENPDKVNVRIKGDLFSAALFMGLLMPYRPIGGDTVTPRIFHGIDIGWDYAPHNLVVAAVNEQAIDLPSAKYFYTINVERVSPMRVVDANIPDDPNKKAAELRKEAHKFMLGL